MRTLGWLMAAGLATGGGLGCERERPQSSFFAEDTADPDRVDTSHDQNETDVTGIGGSGTSGADLDARDPAHAGSQGTPVAPSGPVDEVESGDRGGALSSDSSSRTE